MTRLLCKNVNFDLSGRWLVSTDQEDGINGANHDDLCGLYSGLAKMYRRCQRKNMAMVPTICNLPARNLFGCGFGCCLNPFNFNCKFPFYFIFSSLPISLWSMEISQSKNLLVIGMNSFHNIKLWSV